MNREQRKRRLNVKCQLERLETRWLMRVSVNVEAAMRPLEAIADQAEARVEVVTRRLSAQIGQWLSHHPSTASTVDLADQKTQIQKFMPTDLGNWGTLRVLDRLEARGDHQFDLVYQQLAARFDHWAVRHPVQARLSGVTAAPLQPASPTGSADSSSSPIQAGTGASSTPPLHGVAPDGGPPPPIIPLDTFSLFYNCNCGGTVNQAAAPANAPTPQARGGPGGGSSGSGTGASPVSDVSYTPRSLLDSDASLITGEYFQDHQLATYQSQGVLNGIDFQYSSLQADPYPIVTAFLTTAAGSNSASITSITASMTVNGVSQGSAVTYDDVSLTDG